MTRVTERQRLRQRSAAALLAFTLGCGSGVPAGSPAPPEGGAANPAGTAAPPLDGSAAASSDTAALRPSGAEPASPRVLPGIDVAVRTGGGPLKGRRVGLITNHTGVDSEGRSSIDLLHEHPDLELVALFGPEHGIRGTEDVEFIAGGRDDKTGLPIHSLYGETRKPTPAMLRGVEVLAFDIQDIGTRYYTYVWTMALAMEAAAQQGIPFVVLDRPNPIGGVLVQGNVLKPEFKSFVGLYPVPMRHGLTAGELARLLNAEYGIGADLTVVPVEGWTRSRWFDETGLPWVKPSPNMPSLESATHYPGVCLYEAVNLSVGRGTPIAFQQFGAPWLRHEELVRRLEARGFPGVRFEAVTFTPNNPGDRRYPSELVRGVRLVATDREVYDPVLVAVAALLEIRQMHPDQLQFRTAGFDRLAGNARLRESIQAGASLEQVIAPWRAELEAFERKRQKHLLYR